MLSGLINLGLVMRGTRLRTQASAYIANSARPINFACGIIKFEKMLKYLKLEY